MGNAIYDAAKQYAATFLSEGVSSAKSKSESKSNGSKSTSKKSKPLGNDFISIDGTRKRRTKSKRKRSKRKKKSLKKRIVALERNQVPMSHYFYDLSVPVLVSDSAGNRARIYELDMLNSTIIEGVINNLDGVDFTAVNSEMKLKNIWLNFFAKNNATSNMFVKYVFVRCIDDDSESYIENWREHIVDRGLTISSATTAHSAASATQAEFPLRQPLLNAERFYPIFNLPTNRKKYRQIGKVQSFSLAPGDSINMSHSQKSMRYYPEHKDQEPFTNVQGDLKLILFVHGDLGHQNVSNTSLVGYSAFRLDAVRRTKFEVEWANEKALRIMEFETSLDNTNLTDVVHADNRASAIEKELETN